MDNSVQQSVEQPSGRSLLEYQLQPNDRLCYVHIPKTAGTTFTSVLDAQFNQQDICPAQLWDGLVKIPRSTLAQYRLFRGHIYYPIRDLLPQKPIYVTMLRDPIERVMSSYEFARRWPEMPSHKKAMTLTLKEFVSDPAMFPVQNAQTRHFTDNLYKQVPDLRDRRWVENAMEHLQEFTFVGLTEQFQQSMALLSYTFGWSLSTEFQNLMVTPRKLKRDELPQDVLDTIAEFNQLDLELYQFAQSIFHDRCTAMITSLQTRFPNSQDVQGQFEQHYQQRYAALNLPLQETLTFTFDQAMAGTGWQLREGSREQGLVFRWMGPGTTATLDLPLKRDRPLAIELRVVNAIAPDVLESLQLMANGHSVPLFALYRDRYTTILRGTLLPSVLETTAAFTRLTFQVDRTLSHQDVDSGNPDDRPVGVAFDLIQIFPVEQLAIASLIGDPFENRAYQETVAFIKSHIQPGELVLAPNVFSLKLGEFMSYMAPQPPRKTGQYGISVECLDPFQWVVLSKDIRDEIGPILKQLAPQGFKPVYADEVFVVFTTHPELPTLDFHTPHVKSLFVGQLKFVLGQRVNDLGRTIFVMGRSVKRFFTRLKSSS